MPAYAFAHLRDRKPHPEVYTYLERIQATLTPYSGRFLAHGDTLEVRRGSGRAASSCWSSPVSPRPAPGTTPTPTRRSSPCAPAT